MKFDIANEMDGILKSPDHVKIFEKPVVKTAAVKVKKTSAYEECVKRLVGLSAFFDKAGLEKSAAFTLLALDSMIEDSDKCNDCADSDDNDMDIGEYLERVPREELATDPNLSQFNLDPDQIREFSDEIKHNPQQMKDFVEEIELLPSTTKTTPPPAQSIDDILGPDVEPVDEMEKGLENVASELHDALVSLGAKKDPAKEKAKAKAQAEKEKAKVQAAKEKEKAKIQKEKEKAKADKEKEKAKAEKEKAALKKKQQAEKK